MPDNSELKQTVVALLQVTAEISQALELLELGKLEELLEIREGCLAQLQAIPQTGWSAFLQTHPQLKIQLEEALVLGATQIQQIQELLATIQEQQVQLTAGKRASYAYIGKDEPALDTSMFFEDQG